MKETYCHIMMTLHYVIYKNYLIIPYELSIFIIYFTNKIFIFIHIE
jgi:hypothetical protein